VTIDDDVLLWIEFLHPGGNLRHWNVLARVDARGLPLPWLADIKKGKFFVALLELFEFPSE
jgi:hypothetical protein